MSEPEITDGQLDIMVKSMATQLRCMDTIEEVQQKLLPGHSLNRMLLPIQRLLLDSTTELDETEFPERYTFLSRSLLLSSLYTLRACGNINDSETETFAVLKAMRSLCRAQETLYPLASFLKPINKYFLEEPAKDNIALIDALSRDLSKEERELLGYLPGNDDRKQRGGYCLYVPENIDLDKPTPLVVALHGGSGHGADFIWYWLREARTRGFILLAPTSQGNTWSLMGEKDDLPTLLSTLDEINAKYKIDQNHILLTGMSDGGTYAMLAGIREKTPFTHLAPFSCVLHPDISLTGQIRFAEGRNIYLVHGTHDWMFPVEAAQMARVELEAAGANLHLRIIEGLTHTYWRSENDEVLRWFDPRLTVPMPPSEDSAAESEQAEADSPDQETS